MMLLVFQSGSAADVPYSVMTRIHTVATCLSFFMQRTYSAAVLIMDFSVAIIIHFAHPSVNLKTEEIGAKIRNSSLIICLKNTTGND